MSRSDADYLAWVVEHAGSRADRERPRWSFVAEIFGLGSTSAWEMCKRFGFDPEEIMGRFLDCGEGCDCECHHD